MVNLQFLFSKTIRRSATLFVCLFFSCSVLTANQIATSDDGRMVAIRTQTGIRLIHFDGNRIIENTEVLHRYKFEQMKFSGNGEWFFIYSDGYFWRCSIKELFLLKANWQLTQINAQKLEVRSFEEFNVNYEGTIIVAGHSQNDQISKSGCQPQFIFPFKLSADGTIDTIIKPIDCRWMKRIDISGNERIIGEMSGRIDSVFSYSENTSQPQLKNFRLTQQFLSSSGYEILVCGKARMPDSILQRRKKLLDEYLMERYNINNADLKKRNKEQWKKQKAEYKIEKQKLFAPMNDSVLTLLLTTFENGTWTKPKPILPPHKDAVYMYSVMSKDAKQVAWVQLNRDKDGNRITSKQIMLVTKQNQVWSKPVSIYTLQGFETGFTGFEMKISNSNLIIYTLKEYVVITELDSARNVQVLRRD